MTASHLRRAAPEDGSTALVAYTSTTTSLPTPAQPGLGSVHQQAAGLRPCVSLTCVS
jgi:hypothetical protein